MKRDGGREREGGGYEVRAGDERQDAEISTQERPFRPYARFSNSSSVTMDRVSEQACLSLSLTQSLSLSAAAAAASSSAEIKVSKCCV